MKFTPAKMASKRSRSLYGRISYGIICIRQLPSFCVRSSKKHNHGRLFEKYIMEEPEVLPPDSKKRGRDDLILQSYGLVRAGRTE